MRVQIPLTAVILAAAAAFSMRAQGEAGGLVCGGIGADERAALARETSGADLALELFVAKRGDYLVGAQISVTPLDGRAHGATLRETAEGALCFMKLAPGRYRVEGDFNGVTRSARVLVRPHASHPARVALAFPEEAVREDLGPQPTPREREEAKTP